MIKTVLFDLDGTLLPMDLDIFTKAYIGSLSATLSGGEGDVAKKIAEGTMAGVYAMVKNDGQKTNEEVFWESFDKFLPAKQYRDSKEIEHYYSVEFQKIKEVCSFTTRAAEIVKKAKELSFKVVLATNPLFPMVATESRIKWAGLDRSDFEYVSCYESSHFSKPSLGYYREILDKLGLLAEECLMVGNDADEDMIAKELGMQVFLLTDCLINKKGRDISLFPSGSFDALETFLVSLKV
jgi:FMN phosphatase YigB (HAD superfamily)